MIYGYSQLSALTDTRKRAVLLTNLSVQSTYCRLQTGYKMQTKNCFFVWFFSSDISIWFATLLESGKSIDNSCVIANIFNHFLVNEGRNADKHISQGNCCPSSFLNGNFPESMFLSPITSLEDEYYISQMDNNKSIGPCSIPVPLLKILKTQIFHFFHP